MKKNIIVLFGGKSAEHDISIITARQVVSSLDENLYNIFPIFADGKNEWYYVSDIKNLEKRTKVFLEIGSNKIFLKKRLNFLKEFIKVDCAILCFHGMNGEDGSVQGLLELCNIPYTSSGILASSVSMDKIFMKKMFESFNFNVVDYIYFNRCEYEQEKQKILKKIEKKLKFPVIVKPSNLGSSIGINKCNCPTELENAIDVALQFDNNILVEKAITNFKEINCAGIGYISDVIISSLEEPVNYKEFLTFDDKYKSNNKKCSKRIYPAKIEKSLENKIKLITKKIFRDFNLCGVARIDYIVKDDEIFVNEINSIPGSLAFYLFEKENLSFSDVLNKLIDIALKKQEDKNRLTYTFDSGILNNIKK